MTEVSKAGDVNAATNPAGDSSPWAAVSQWVTDSAKQGSATNSSSDSPNGAIKQTEGNLPNISIENSKDGAPGGGGHSADDSQDAQQEGQDGQGRKKLEAVPKGEGTGQGQQGAPGPHEGQTPSGSSEKGKPGCAEEGEQTGGQGNKPHPTKH